jgi:hypothetical protein
MGLGAADGAVVVGSGVSVGVGLGVGSGVGRWVRTGGAAEVG